MPELPSDLQQLLDGTDLEDKIGTTFLLTSCKDGGWPYLALLSVGETLAVRPDRLRLLLHARSRTTDALATTGRGLVVAVVNGTTYKVGLTVRRSAISHHGLRALEAHVERCESDVVAYAQVRHGIEYDLADPEATLKRWRRQLERLRREPA